jgi:nucleoid-associated protein YgaU
MADPKTTGQASAGAMSQVTIAVLVGFVLVAVAIGFAVMRGTPESAPEATEAAAAPQAPVEAAEDAPVEAAEAEESETEVASEAPVTEEAAEETSEAPAEEAVAAPEPPRFDLVRVDATGSAVIAGRAPAEASVVLVLDGEIVETVTADAGGQFAAFLSLEPSEAPRILGLRAVMPDGTEIDGAGTALIAPFAGPVVAEAPEAPAPEPVEEVVAEAPAEAPADEAQAVADAPAEAAPTEVAAEEAVVAEAEPVAEVVESAPEAAPEPVEEVAAVAEPVVAPEPAPAVEVAEAVASAPVEEAAQVPVVEPAPVAAPEAPAVLLADETGVRVLQGPGGAAETLPELRLDAITYDVAGAVTLAGRAPGQGDVRATLDNREVTSGAVGPGGEWSLDLPDVDPGTYTLRLEQLAADGSVTGRIETPFLREDPDRIRDNPMLVDPGATVITVQRGFTLWGIAEANFGDGIRYVQIFEENRDLIRDPDLIFPGQIFALPDLPRARP